MRKVIIVDNEESYANSLAARLVECGFASSVFSESAINEGLKILEAGDAFISDHFNPFHLEAEHYKEARRKVVDGPVIWLTNDTDLTKDFTYSQRARELGINACLSKTEDEDYLIALLSEPSPIIFRERLTEPEALHLTRPFVRPPKIKVRVLVEIPHAKPETSEFQATALDSAAAIVSAGESLLKNLDGSQMEVTADFAPIALCGEDALPRGMVVSAEMTAAKYEELRTSGKVKVWPNSDITLFNGLRSGGGIDCPPFLPGVEVELIQQLLEVEFVWQKGFRGQGMVVGIIDAGVSGAVYPVIGGFSPHGGPLPGIFPVTSHGSMCAAGIMVAAPEAKLYDYPFLGVPRSGGAIMMFDAVLKQRQKDGTPHLTNNSYGLTSVPPRRSNPDHEVWNLNHPLHRKIREVVAAGCPAFFAAGNCGVNCPAGICDPSGIGPGKSIHAFNSLAEVITVAAVNSLHQRIGSSSQGPGMYSPKKPDLAAYSHFFGNFGPGRPGGMTYPFDNGTSAASAVAAGVGALLMSAFRDLSPARLKEALIQGATMLGSSGWHPDHGYGVMNAKGAFEYLIS